VFLNVDSFKKKQVLFNRGEDYFTIDGVRKEFIDIAAFFCSSTEHFTNQVYEGNSLRVMLQFTEAQQLECYEVDSNHQEHYSLLHHIAAAIETFRRERLETSYKNGETVSFVIKGENKSLCLQDSALFLDDERVKSLVIDTNDKNPQLEFVLPARTIVVERYANDLYVELNGEQPPEEVNFSVHSLFVKLPAISDSALFLELASKILPTTHKLPSKKERNLSRIFICTIAIFGINGWLEMGTGYGLLMDNRLVEIFSDVASFLLAIWLFLRPFFWLVDRSNGKKMERRLRQLEVDGCKK